MDVRMFVNSNVRNAYIWVLAVIVTNDTERRNRKKSKYGQKSKI